MNRILHSLFLVLLFVAAGGVRAQSSTQTSTDSDPNSQQVEQSDEAFRKRMELEDARRRQPGYQVPTPTNKPKQEKIDMLPRESRDNIRDQLLDIVIENGEWPTGGAPADYPYKPTEAARADPALLQQEREAWDEQVQKYNERQAAAAGVSGNPAPGRGKPIGKEGNGETGTTADPGTAGATDSRTVSTEAYKPNHDRPEDGMSTAGVSESALEFLRGRQTPAGSSPSGSTDPSEQPAAMAQAESTAQQKGAQAESNPDTGEAQDQAEPGRDDAKSPERQQRTQDLNLDTPGLLAIKDLDKLQGTESTDDSADDNR